MVRENTSIDNDIADYSNKKALYEILASYTARFLSWHIKKQFPNITWPLIHTDQYRSKSIKSLKNRLLKNELSSFKDLAGARVIFHFKDDLEYLCNHNLELINTWFGIEAKESFKRKIDPLTDVFGYDSYHFNYKVNHETDFYKSLREYDQIRLQGLWCEVQLRTILQHAWAEAEHELLYKRNSDYTFSNIKELEEKRKWVMHAASIESLDDQFVRRKADLKQFIDQKEDDTASNNNDRHDTSDEGVIINGRNYNYIHLHTGDPGEIKIISDWTLYNVNDVYELESYKSDVWAALIESNRVFIDNLQSYDTPIVRLKDFNIDKKELIVQPAVYSDQIVTNHTKCHDIVVLKHNKTIKELNLDEQSKIIDLNESKLSNTIGVSCIIRTVDDRWVLSERKSNLAIDSEQLACSASGTIEWRERGMWNDWSVIGWFGASIQIECTQELGININKNFLTYLGIYRELRRLGKPQVFFLIDMFEKPGGLSVKQIDASWHIYATDHEFEKLIFKSEYDLAKILNNNESNCSQELKMNLALALCHLGIIL